MPTRLLIAGASVRAQVQSALRAGYSVAALDLFADRDTRWIIEQTSDRPSSIVSIDQYRDVLNHSHELQACDAGILCGGIENRIELVRALENRIELLGPRSFNLLRLQDPLELSRLLESGLGEGRAQIPPTVAQVPRELDAAGWLSKRIGSSGGLGVESAQLPADFDQAVDPQGHREIYFQQRIAGENISVLYVSHAPSVDQEPSCKVIGVTQQLVGDPRLGASEFQYCGSIGPFAPWQPIGSLGVKLGESRISQIEMVGDFLSREFGLVGVWGIDFIVNQSGAWPVDVNPRITASAELYEAAIAADSGFKSVIDLHVNACQALEGLGERVAGVGVRAIGAEPELVEGKVILFNRTGSEIEISDEISDALMNQFNVGFFEGGQPGVSVVDVPCPAQTIKPGHPLLTVRVRCPSAKEVQFQLHETAERIYHCL